MDPKEYAAHTAAAITTALETYRRDKRALQNAEQAAARTGQGGHERGTPLEALRSSLAEQRRELIQLQNDRFRITRDGGEVYITAGMQGRGEAFVQACLAAVREFATFDENNDPYGEHDFGVLEIAGQKVFWKIDAYDRERIFGSEDPADPALTLRVLTFCLPEEY